ncbi:MAG: transporter substrate-binding domain-containing protein [Proteobacteria bacterium]|nr:transporter substrate-binding domain-containing protein [Pseudomonadota bacterium]
MKRFSSSTAAISRRLAAAFVALFSVCGSAHADNVIRFATLEWPPYVSSHLPGLGMTAKILSDIAQDRGSDARFAFLPWVRAMRYAQEDPDYAGYFPAYWTEERARTCSFSDPIGVSEVGFVQRKDAPVTWNKLEDLAGMRIGIVNGYANGAEFDALVTKGVLTTEGAAEDLDNLRKVAIGHLALAVIDHAVMDYYAATDSVVSSRRGEIEFNTKPLIEMTVHVCFKKNAEGAAFKQMFDEGLKRVDLREMQRSYLARLVR